MITGPEVLKIALMVSSTSRASAWNCGPRWSMVGFSIACRMSSGTLVGPGICRKCRPALTLIVLLRGSAVWRRAGWNHKVARRAEQRPAAAGGLMQERAGRAKHAAEARSDL